ncbi:MAG TPA: hypothetical protein VKU82_03330, partial [Planctomycetaceae bacterium]|nr:hypothetical protein [Planctomycetaceae bacterium]
MNDFTQGILEHWEQSPAVVRLGSALLHFVWQGALAAAFTWAILVVLNRVRPQVRYLASLVALGALAVCPVITFAVVEVAVTAPAAVLPPDDRPAIPATVRQAGSSAGNSSALIPLATAAEAWNDRFGNALNWLQQHRPWV